MAEQATAPIEKPAVDPNPATVVDPAAGKATTVIDPSAGGAPAVKTGADPTAAPSWRADWRAALSKGDDKVLKRLERYTSPEAIADALIAAQNKFASDELKSPLPQGATPEQVDEWRKDNGIPLTAEGYLAALPQGLVIGDADKARVGAYLDKLHQINAPPAVVAASMQWYYDNLAELQTERHTQDGQFQTAAEDALHTRYGNDYRVNIDGLKTLFGSQGKGAFNGSEYLPQPVAQALANARTGEGRPILSDPEIIDWFVTMSRDLYPEVFRTVAPGSGAAQGQGLDQRIAQIEKLMRDDRKEYVRIGADKELLQLYAARGRTKKRSAA